MTACSNSSRWASALAFSLAGLIAVGAAMLLAGPARTAANTFEINLEGRYEPVAVDETGVWYQTRGTFSSGPPFCTTGKFADLGEGVGRTTRQFTCDDDTGTLTVSFTQSQYEPAPPGAGEGIWRILDATGSYAGLRGRGSLRGELLGGEMSDPGSVTWRSTFHGAVDRDAVAPTVALPRAKVTKLRRPSGAYAIKLALALRDDAEGNAVTYMVRATAVRTELVRTFGTATTPIVPVTLRIWPQNARVKKVRIQVVAEDPIGNSASFRRVLTLPR
jgi:hypothetical protein